MSAPLLIHLLTIATFMGLLVSAAVGDIRTFRIANVYSLALMALYPLYAWSAPHPVAPLASAGVMLAVLVAGFVAFATGLIGGGDAKLASAVALYAGPALVFEFLMVTALAGGLIALLLTLRPLRLGLAVAMDHWGHQGLRNALLKDTIPYGVAIAAGGIYLTLRLAGMAAMPA